MAAETSLKHLVVPSVGEHTATVIFVHGLGDTGDGWKPAADMFQADPALAHIKWILPHSPILKVTANMGMKMPSWFDIYSFDFDGDEDETGMLKSVGLINQLITAEVDSGIDPGRIVLGGFSQGAAMSLLTGLTGERKLAGIVALSGWLPLMPKFKGMASQHASSIPIFLGHGSADPLIKLQICKQSVHFLTNFLGIPLSTDQTECKGLTFTIYDGMEHTTTPKELHDLKAWIARVIPKSVRSSV